MAVGVVDIFNLALGHIGEGEVLSATTDRTAAAKACRRFYEPARDAVFEAFDWAFARRIEKPVLLGDTPAQQRPPGWAYLYLAPSTLCAAIRHVYSSDGAAAGLKDPRVPYALLSIGDDNDHRIVIACNEAAPLVVYTRLIIGTHFYPPLFVDALGWRLAADVAVIRTRSQEIRAEALRSYQEALALAQRSQAAQQYALPAESDFITARA